MPLLKFIKGQQNALESGGRTRMATDRTDPELTCPNCRITSAVSEVWQNFNVCPHCSYHYKTGARQRIKLITDKGSFTELFTGTGPEDLLEFPGYKSKLKAAMAASNEEEAVVCGECTIGGVRTAIFIMEHSFMMGSMGTAVGEKILKTFEYAIEKRLPVTGFTVSGGARMQEGLFSLMQMAKTSGAVGRHSAAGLFYLPVLTSPTTGGVTASFAMEGDIILAEPGATIGFAGARVVEQTTRKALPKGFQTAESMLEHGFIDMIVPRNKQRKLIARLLKLHTDGGETKNEQA